MFNEIIKEIDWCGHTLTVKTGKVARQADGAVMISMGDTVLLCNAVSAKSAKVDAGFFPLTVHYREMAFSAGKIPGGFLIREGKSSDREVLVSRLIDRPLRPLFHPSFFNETQIICTVLSYDPKHTPDILAIIGASASLAIAGVPVMEVIAGIRVGYINGEMVVNPSFEAMKESKLELIIAGTETSVMMVESEAHELSEEQMLQAVEFGHSAMQPVIKMIKELAAATNNPKWPEPAPMVSQDLIAHITKHFGKEISDAYSIHEKPQRMTTLIALHKSLTESLQDKPEITALQIHLAFEEAKALVLRKAVLDTKKRIDGRKVDEVRQISCEASLFPKAHGSSLFTRGETQALVATTLGTTQDEQIIDGLNTETREHFMLQYSFPPYSVGETSPLRAPGRREVGHGKLAWRALNPVMPSKEEFPYTVRVVAEITESNGSSSMATVCGSSLAMMDAGVPLKAPVSGIAMGLIKEGEEFVVLSDILGDEDYLGDMDFKVAGTAAGVTALQMDIKITGITFEIMKQALKQARAGRMHILQEMSKVLETHREVLSDSAPMIRSLKINKDKIRDVIGPGGKVIKDICEKTTAKIDIKDDGSVQVSAIGSVNLEKAVAMIMAIAGDPEVGQIFEGTVVKILDSGAFVNYLPGRDGFVHVSEMSDARVERVSDFLQMDQAVKVKVLGTDPRGKIKLSLRLDATGEKPRAQPQDTYDNKDREHKKDDVKPKRHQKRERIHKKPSSDESPTHTAERKYFN